MLQILQPHLRWREPREVDDEFRRNSFQRARAKLLGGLPRAAQRERVDTGYGARREVLWELSPKKARDEDDPKRRKKGERRGTVNNHSLTAVEIIFPRQQNTGGACRLSGTTHLRLWENTACWSYLNAKKAKRKRAGAPLEFLGSTHREFIRRQLTHENNTFSVATRQLQPHKISPKASS